MNKVIIIGRTTKEPELKYTTAGKPVCRFTLAVDRVNSDADFINCVAFGKNAENIDRYIGKGRQIAIEGSIKTGSYDGKNGKVFTTDVWVDRFDFLSGGEKKNEAQKHDVAEAFAMVDDDTPF